MNALLPPASSRPARAGRALVLVLLTAGAVAQRPLPEVLGAAGLPEGAAPVLGKTPAGSPGFVEAARTRGLSLGAFCAQHLQLEPAQRTARGVLELATALHGAPAKAWEPGAAPVRRATTVPAAARPPLDTVKEIERFFYQHHRAVRKALGLDTNLARSTPLLHSLLERLQADPEYALSGDERRMLGRERRLIGRVDLPGLLAAAAELLDAVERLEAGRGQLLRLPVKQAADGVTGTVLYDRETTYGRLVIGGPGRNIYDCNRVSVVIDLGGDDRYEGAAGGADEMRRYAVCIDLQGADEYACGGGALGSATYGLGACIDVDGDDVYKAGKRSAGFGLAGVGLFVDTKGDDRLSVGDASAGVGMHGVGVCVDLAGADAQRGGGGSFGIGLPGGVGLFVDAAGDDDRQIELQTGRVALGFGAAQGVDAGDASGLGVCLDLAGDDSYAAGGQALGAGDRGGLGVCIDSAGTDTYIAKELSLGTGRRGGAGVMLDVEGRDHYFATESLGVALAGSVGFFADAGGDDIYEVFGIGMGRAAAAGLAVFEDRGGTDSYRWKPQVLQVFPRQLAQEDAGGGLSVFRARGPRDKYLPAMEDPAGFTPGRRDALRRQGRWFVLE